MYEDMEFVITALFGSLFHFPNALIPINLAGLMSLKFLFRKEEVSPKLLGTLVVMLNLIYLFYIYKP
ncbi:hypothetical protein CN495_08045 [Bacillus thuringiensis]|uniref:Uncharacterized protein n=1 Tax=Bacillus thuringiensis TaxID=1428 RepID=A0ABD6SAW7_BACTU|nr:hypothetical protein CN495_08045 [Bacillus thuringiensis]